MAYDGSKFGRISSHGNSQIAQIYGYATNDTLATVVGSDYFGDAVDESQVQAMDVIECRYDEDGTPGHARLIVTSVADGSVTVGQVASDNAVWLSGSKADVATAGSVYFAAPFAGTIRRIRTTIGAALGTANNTITCEINGSAVTLAAAHTIAYSGSAAGDVDNSVAIAANAIAENDTIEIITDGGGDNTVPVHIEVECIPTAIVQNTTWITGTIANVGATTSTWLAAPYAGTIRKWKTVLTGITTFGATDSVLTLEIGGTLVTGSTLTISGTGEAIGDVDAATCTAANVVTAGQAVEIVCDGGAGDTCPANYMIEFVPS